MNIYINIIYTKVLRAPLCMLLFSPYDPAYLYGCITVGFFCTLYFTLLITDLLYLMHPEQELRSQQGKVRCFSSEFILQYS